MLAKGVGIRYTKRMLMVIFRRYSLYAAIFIALFWVAYVSLSLLSERSSYLGRLILETEAFADLPEFLGQTSTGTAVAAVLPAVVRVVAYRDEKLFDVQVIDGQVKAEQVGKTRKNVRTGTAFFISDDGYLITNKHVVADDRALYVVHTGKDELPANVVYRDPKYDLSILKVEGSAFPTISFSDTSPTEGDVVATVGNAFGRVIDSTSQGKILGLNRKIVADGGLRGEELLDGLIESDALLFSGDSGGPLLNVKGEAVGVNVAISTDEARSSFSITAKIAKEVIARAGIFVN